MALDLKALRGQDNPTIQRQLKDLQRHLFDLRTQGVTEKLEDPTQLGKTRRDIARVKTILRQREIEQKQQQTPAATQQ